MKPSIGRIVHYCDMEGKILAGVVVAVMDEENAIVNLAVWSEFGKQCNALNVRQGHGCEQWNWPARG
ncbi:hypothetical protein [Paenibacillus sanguinis]|uniref:hypothetical protein n=1 Tax=Paenibacillus sanguinis TaxID=225906 RepID=UPI0003814E51|nr:hypothetical protein [Paenibacillus sanguinis]